MYFVYIIESVRHNKFYIGYTGNIKDRLERHEQGRERFTKKYLPWTLVYTKTFENKSEALKYEKYLKSLKSKIALEKLKNEWRGGSSIG